MVKTKLTRENGERRKMKTIYEKEADILDASFIFYIVVFFTTILVLW